MSTYTLGIPNYREGICVCKPTQAPWFLKTSFSGCSVLVLSVGLNFPPAGLSDRGAECFPLIVLGEDIHVASCPTLLVEPFPLKIISSPLGVGGNSANFTTEVATHHILLGASWARVYIH